jgi:hypothetical protein
MITTKIQDSATSWFKARMMPTTRVMGAVISMFKRHHHYLLDLRGIVCGAGD